MTTSNENVAVYSETASGSMHRADDEAKVWEYEAWQTRLVAIVRLLDPAMCNDH